MTIQMSKSVKVYAFVENAYTSTEFTLGTVEVLSTGMRSFLFQMKTCVLQLPKSCSTTSFAITPAIFSPPLTEGSIGFA